MSLDKKTVKIRVIYADTDAMGIVYHTNYIRWFETGRTEFFRNIGIAYRDVESGGFNLPLTQAYCHYHLPARYDDLVLLETDIDFIKRASIKFVHKIWDEDDLVLLETDIDFIKRASIKFVHKIWDEEHKNLLAEGYTVHACTDSFGKVIRIPAMITDRLKTAFKDGERHTP